MSALARSPRGRVWLLQFLAAAEADEEGVFEQLLSRVDDAELRKIVRIHRDDEKVHFALIKDCVARYGIEAPPVLTEHRLASHVDRVIGGFWASFEGGRIGVMEVYVLLQVLEELSVSVYPFVIRALAPHDPKSARVIEGVMNDEARHVKYARAISRRYAPDGPALERTLRQMRSAEQRASRACNLATLRYAVANDLLDVPRMEMMFWRTAARVA